MDLKLVKILHSKNIGPVPWSNKNEQVHENDSNVIKAGSNKCTCIFQVLSSKDYWEQKNTDIITNHN